MSELGISDLDLSKTESPHGKKPSVTNSWGQASNPDETKVPVHLFLSPSSSVHSASSQSSRSNRNREAKLIEETSFSSTPKEVGREPLSPSTLQTLSSSDTDNYSSSQSKIISRVKKKSNVKTNKIHDLNTRKEIKKKKIKNVASSNHLKSEKPTKNSESVICSASDICSDGENKKTSAVEMSYREKIRDRFITKKERAAELLRPQSRNHAKLKPLTSDKRGKLVENLLKQEENEVTAVLERHEKVKMHWREVLKNSIEKERHAVKNFQFFGENDERNSSSISSAEEIKNVTKQETSTESQDDSKMLTSELLGLKEEYEFVKYAKPKIVDLKNEKSWEEKLFQPSTRRVPLENKIESGIAARHVEEEGLYVKKNVNVPVKIKNKMEQRLLMTPEGRKWFGKDGELISPTCSLKPFCTRPYFDDNISPSTFVTFKPATLGDLNHRYINLSGNLNYVLDVDISTVEFTHHPLFSREHVLAMRLKDLYVKYKKRKEMDNLNRLNGRLEALRKSRNNLKNLISQGGDNQNFRDKLLEYEKEIREVRKMRYTEGQIDKQLTNKIKMTWEDLQKLRQQQGYENTPVKLVTKKIEKNLKEEKLKWNTDIKLEAKEIIEELKRANEKMIEEYKGNYKIWSKKNKKRFSNIKKTTEKKKSTEITSDSDNESDLEEFFDEEPKRPQTIDISNVLPEVTENFKKSFRNPGEPEIEFSMTKSPNIQDSAYSNKEELRRAALKRCTIFVKLFYNGKEVCRSKSQPLGQNFSVTIGQRFAVRILEWPETLMIEIHEETGAFNKNLLVSGIYLPFPDSFATLQNSEIEKLEFSSNISVSYHHAGVGSGNKIIPCPEGSDFNSQPICLFTSGIVACSIGWMDDNGKILSPPEKYWCNKKEETITNLFEILKSGGSFNVAKLKEWTEESKLDPNDPHNAAFFNFLENAGERLEEQPSYFRLDALLNEFDFCEENDIQNNIRFTLLTFRDGGEPEFKEMKMLPLNEKQIPKEIFKDYEKRTLSSGSLNDAICADPLDGHRAWGKKYLEQVQQKMLKQCRMSKQNKRYSDIVKEESVPDIGTLGLTFMKWLHPKRPLRPVRKERKKITPQNLSGEDVNIVVNVVRAFEVPVRKDVDGIPTEDIIDGFSLVNVRPFVEISFGGVSARTTAAEGANPTWNQDLKIPVTSKTGQLSPEKLHSIKHSLYLHLFDEVIIDLVEDEKARQTNIHQRLERHWLASMKIPFSTLYFNSKIEGTFKLYSPPVLLGYERQAHRRHFGESADQESLLPQRDATYITLFVTVQPALNPFLSIKEKTESSENINLEKHLEEWEKEIACLFPHRKVKTLVLDITGKSVCVTRFIKALPPPPVVEKDEITAEMVARFVAMIPFAAERTVSSGFFDIWITGDQLLQLLCGNSEDHAVLLCCYLLHLDFKAYVLIGSGIPHGLMAYVLAKEEINKTAYYFLWDATNGQKYTVDDSFCPLQKVYCLINDQNIWANVQAEEAPRRTRFDLSKRADWYPVFSKKILAPTESVQPQSLPYKPTSRQAVDILQDKIEKKLRESVMKWRQKRRTQWNRYCAATLRKLLPKLEDSTWNSTDNFSPDHILELQHILASYKMCGFPINMAYTNVEAVIEAVKATGVHCNESEGVEFALAVYVHPYPNDVLSVWIYIASLIRRR